VRGQLHDVHLRALRAAAELGCRTVAFPAISTGAYRFPIDRAASIALRAAADALAAPSSLELVRFVLYRPSQFEVFETELKNMRDAPA
jgi:O-acetyl-ADP-ribose deacetylase (regulator of RNase III)